VKRLLYYAPFSYGGLLNYAQEQANAIARQGVEVALLCTPEFTKRDEDDYHVLPLLTDTRPKTGQSKVWRPFRHVWVTLSNLWRLRREIIRGSYRHVLFASYGEYFAPLWARWFRPLAARGVVFGAVVQEPVRDFQVGPRWWHRFSVWSGYSFLRYAFTHDVVRLDTCGEVSGLQTAVVPYGPHKFPEPTQSRAETRKKLGVPESALLLFSFGHIRDNKNLDYAVRALAELPEAWLLVAGARSASSQKPADFYVDMAKSLGVAGRCVWRIDYISEEEAANLFSASDLVLLTYSSSFRSASGVLHVAARYRRPCIASAGQGSLQSVVRNYGLGAWIEPGEPDAVVRGVRDWISNKTEPRWDAYDRDNSWDRNAEIVVREMGN
jgi:glycosyltransferase involved in cell wall biosynthesis